MKILHTADIHLKKYDDERWEALAQLIEIAQQEAVELFIISGDLFNKGIDGEVLRPQIRKLFSNIDFQVIVIPGNHDWESFKEGLYFGDKITIINNWEKPWENKKLRCAGLPYQSSNLSKENTLASLFSIKKKLATDKYNILLYHGELLDAFFVRTDFGQEGDDRYMPVKLSYFKDLGFDYVLGGHFHSKFDLWKLDPEGYFVYPGSPISITQKEIGQRKVNIFELGDSPQEYYLPTKHYEQLTITLDPFSRKNPLEIIDRQLNKTHRAAIISLLVDGFIDQSLIGITELELSQKIKEISKSKSAEVSIAFRDISTILQDKLFISFLEKLQRKDFTEEKKQELQELAIKAMMEASYGN